MESSHLKPRVAPSGNRLDIRGACGRAGGNFYPLDRWAGGSSRALPPVSRASGRILLHRAAAESGRRGQRNCDFRNRRRGGGRISDGLCPNAGVAREATGPRVCNNARSHAGPEFLCPVVSIYAIRLTDALGAYRGDCTNTVKSARTEARYTTLVALADVVRRRSEPGSATCRAEKPDAKPLSRGRFQ
jgi:hypothetical protein